MVNFALIGCGRIAQRHAALLAGNHIPDARLIAVCDTVEQRASAMGKKYGVPYFTDMHRMLREMGSQIHAVSVLTESGNHAKHCLELAPYGKGIVVEKPMALKLSEAQAMVVACEKFKAPLFIVKQNRFNLGVSRLKQAIDEGRFGKIILATARVRWRRDQSYYDQDAWRGTKALDGGVFGNHASHHIDLLTWLVGEAESVVALGTKGLARIESEDTGVAIIRFRNGAVGSLEATTATRPKDLEGSVSILGETGSVEIAGFAVNQIRTWNFTQARPEDEQIAKECQELPKDVYGLGHRPFLSHVVRSLMGKEESKVSGRDGLKTVNLLCALLESLDSGRSVSLPPLRRLKIAA